MDGKVTKEKVGLRGRSLGAEIVILLLVASLLPLVIITSGTFYFVYGNLRDDYKIIANSSVERVAGELSNSSITDSESVSNLAIDPNAKALMRDKDSEKWLLKSLDSFMNTHKSVTNAYMGTEEGKMLISPAQTLPAGFDPRTRPWYKDAVAKDGRVIVTEPYENSGQDKGYVVSFAKTVKDDSGNIVGVTAIDVKLATLSNTISNVKIGEKGFAMALSPSGVVIAHRDSSIVGKSGKKLSWINEMLKASKEELSVKINGKEYIGFKKVDKESGIIVVGLIPSNEILNKVLATFMFPMILVVFSIVLAVSIGFHFRRKLTYPITELLSVLNKVKDGDFSKKANSINKDNKEIKLIVNAVNRMIDDMVLVLENVKNTSKEVREASESLFVITKESNAVGEEVAKAAQQIAAGSTEQAAELNESVNISNNLGTEVERSLEDARKMLLAANEVKNSTGDGLRVANILKNTFDENHNANRLVSQRVEILNEKSNEISVITDTIKSITGQTNLLALNASIEAARAGEAGRGFAVVAEEVRKLAEESSKSAAEIESVVEQIRESINSLIVQIKRSEELNGKTGNSVNITSESFIKIDREMKTLEESIDRVGESLKIINNSKEIVVSKISEVASVAQETAATTEEVSASSEEQSAGLQEIVSASQKLTQLSEKLDGVIEKFKI